MQFHAQPTSPGVTRRQFVNAAGVLALAVGMGSGRPAAAAPVVDIVLGRPTDHTAAVSVLLSSAAFCYIEYGHSASAYGKQTAVRTVAGGLPAVFSLIGLSANRRVYYRLRYRTGTTGVYLTGKQYSFSTRRNTGAAFSFTVQGDTHPERAGKMFNAELYAVTLGNIASQQPDFHILLGDDFSIDPLIGKGQATAANVDDVYRTHRQWLSAVGSSVPLFLVNGNHEQAAAYLLDGTNTNPAVLAANSRLKYFPLPITDGFYSVDAQPLAEAGLVRDYYAWEWGDALFVTLDPYWHSSSAVDNVAGVSDPSATTKPDTTTTTTAKDKTAKTAKTSNGKTTDLWKVGIGDTQYAWLAKTLASSKAKYKFVFAHHVLGTGRGGVEVSTNYEWGGQDPKGKSTFANERPNWDLPIHDLMVRHGVSVFFQGHDHIFVHQERDGVVYQSMPNPADDTFSMYNEDAYLSGTSAPNSGHVRVSVGPTSALVEYFLAARSKDTSADRSNRMVAHSYRVLPKVGA